MIDMATWSKGMWLCMIGFGVLMLMAAIKYTNKIEETYHRTLFKLMKNSPYIIISEHLIETGTKSRKKKIRSALNHILLFPEPFFEDGRICKNDMENIQPIMKKFIKTQRLILVFPFAWIVAFTVAMKIYVD